MPRNGSYRRVRPRRAGVRRQERVAAAEQVDRCARRRERRGRVAPDARAEAMRLGVGDAVARAGEEQHVAGVEQRRVHSDDLRVEVEDAPDALLARLVDVECERSPPGAAGRVERDQLAGAGDRRADARVLGPPAPAVGGAAVAVEAPADGDPRSAAHQQLGPPVAVEVGDVGRHSAGLPVRDRQPRRVGSPADAVAALADHDQLPAGDRDVAALPQPAGDPHPRLPLGAGPVVGGARRDREYDEPAAIRRDPDVDGVAEPPAGDLRLGIADSVPVVAQHHDVAAGHRNR